MGLSNHDGIWIIYSFAVAEGAEGFSRQNPGWISRECRWIIYQVVLEMADVRLHSIEWRLRAIRAQNRKDLIGKAVLLHWKS
jgi:hypothetical protein